MDKRDTFENKIKEKLEQVPVSDADAAWESFMPLLDKPRLPFYKHWSAPYLFALALFLTSMGWQEWKKYPEPGHSTFPLVSTIDTLVRRDTIYLVDTVYVFKELYVSGKEKEGISSAQAADAKIQGDVYLREAISSQTEPPSHVAKDRLSDESAEKRQKETPLTQGVTTPGIAKAPSVPYPYQVPDTANRAQQNKPGKSASKGRSMTAPSVTPQQEKGDILEIGLTEGDTSNLSNPPSGQKPKPLLHIEAVSSLMFPISKSIDYSLTDQLGIQLGMEWESGWGIYTGAIYTKTHGELDDEEIMDLAPSVIAGLPDPPADINALDEINLSYRQWYFPLELRWRSQYYSGFSFESSFGLMGNYLVKQEFGYEFENEGIAEYTASTTGSDFYISHLRMGIGSNYLLSKRWGIFLRSHYWLPLTKTGVLGDKMHGLEVGAGVNLFIGK